MRRKARRTTDAIVWHWSRDGDMSWNFFDVYAVNMQTSFNSIVKLTEDEMVGMGMGI
jgi:hypothetical protein